MPNSLAHAIARTQIDPSLCPDRIAPVAFERLPLVRGRRRAVPRVMKKNTIVRLVLGLVFGKLFPVDISGVGQSELPDDAIIFPEGRALGAFNCANRPIGSRLDE